mgnify:CR=1 FL=1
MDALVQFTEFPKIPRWSRNIIITEKIDGTNGVVYVGVDGSVLAGSRTRWIIPEQDNHGFAKWVKAHEIELRELGVGYHHGEWWGNGINRSYALGQGEFALEQALLELENDGSKAAPGFKPAEGVVIYHIQGNLFFKKTLLHDEVPKSLLGKETA